MNSTEWALRNMPPPPDTPRGGDAERLARIRLNFFGQTCWDTQYDRDVRYLLAEIDTRDAALREKDARIAQLIDHGERQAADITARNKLLFPDDEDEDPEANELARARWRYLECDTALREVREENVRLRAAAQAASNQNRERAERCQINIESGV